MIAINAWGYLSSVSQLSHDVLSFLSSVISQLQAALAAHAENITIANVTFDLQHHPVLQDASVQPLALLFAGTGAARHKLEVGVDGQVVDEFLTAHSRRVVLMAAPMSLMLEAILRCDMAVLQPGPSHYQNMVFAVPWNHSGQNVCRQEGLRQAAEASRATVAFLRMLQMQLPEFSRTHQFESCLAFFSKYIRGFCHDNSTTSALDCARGGCAAIVTGLLSEEVADSAAEILIEAFGPELRPSKLIQARSRASTLIRDRFDALCTYSPCEEHNSIEQRMNSTATRRVAALQGSEVSGRSLKVHNALDDVTMAAKDVIDDESLRVLNAEVGVLSMQPCVWTQT